MTGTENADAKWSQNKIEGEDNLQTVNCLRGRLLAEREASRNAREEAEQLGNKLLELENMLKEEAKSRNRAEKKMKKLVKRVESMNISWVRDESEKDVNLSTMSENQESRNSFESSKGSSDLQQNDSQLSLFDGSTTEKSSTSGFEVNFPQLKDQESEMGLIQNKVSENLGLNDTQNNTLEDSLISTGESHFGKPDEQRVELSTGERLNQEDDQDADDHIDNSMALVPADPHQENQTVDPEVLDATVKEVLNALRHAKEQLQNSMERRRMNMIIKVG